jgi:hypothetical protein
MVTQGVASVTLQNLFITFFECFYVKFLWRAVHLMFGISPPLSIDDLFVNWSKTGGNIHNSLILTATSALCWTIWITRNEVVFDKCRLKTFFAGALQGIHWLRQWARLQRRDDLRDQLILLGNIWRHQPYISLLPMDGYQLGLLAFLSQDFTSRFVFPKLVVSF